MSGQQPNAFFRGSQSGRSWKPDERLSLPRVMEGLADAVEHMLRDPRLCLRDQAVIGLLRNTGARASEITNMTVGGYRSFIRDGILGEAMVVNKGSFGIEEKRLDFHEAVPLQRTLLRYLRKERPRWDSEGRKRLADLLDEAPLFLTERGIAYSYKTFKWQWRKVYPAARRHCPIDFSPHDLRHVLVTEWLVRARKQWDPRSSEYADFKQSLVDLFAWADPATIEVYDHSVNHIAALGELGELQRAIAERGTRAVRRAPASLVPPGHEPHETLTNSADRLALPEAVAEAGTAPAGREREGERLGGRVSRSHTARIHGGGRCRRPCRRSRVVPQARAVRQLWRRVRAGVAVGNQAGWEDWKGVRVERESVDGEMVVQNGSAPSPAAAISVAEREGGDVETAGSRRRVRSDRRALNFSDSGQRAEHIAAFMAWLPPVLRCAPEIDWEDLPSRVMGYLMRTAAQTVDVLPITLAVACALSPRRQATASFVQEPH